jgi:spermidine/putrescine transport system permease protein
VTAPAVAEPAVATRGVAVIGGQGAPPALRRAASRLLDVWAALALVYLFAPIFVIVLFSFNRPAGKFNYVWQEFTLENWQHPFAKEQLVDAFVLSLQIAAIATAVAVTLGTLIALALVRYRFRGNAVVNLLLVLPLTTPEIVLGASLLTLVLDPPQPHQSFAASWDNGPGFRAIVIAHVLFCLSFVALTVKARIRGFDWTLEDAAMDLGATPWRTFRKVTLPLIMPAIFAAALLSFALSLDDFIITLFVRGDETTFPIQVYGASRVEVPPQINVLASMVLFGSVALLGLGTLFQARREGR